MVIGHWLLGQQPTANDQYPFPKETLITPKKWRWAAIAGVLALALLVFIRFRRQGELFDWRLFVSTFSRLDWSRLAMAAILSYGTYYGRALRWAVFLRPLRPHPSMWNLVKATVIGSTAVILLGRPGEFVRPYLISVKENVSLTSQLAAWFLERLFDLLFALAIFGYGLSRLGGSSAHIGRSLERWFEVGGSVVWTLSAITLGLLILLRRFPELFRERMLGALGFLHEHHMARAEKLINTFLQGAESVRSTQAILLTALYTALEWILIGGCYLFILKSFGQSLRFGLMDVFIYMGFVAFGTVIQLPGVGGGMQVVSVLVLHEIFGVPVEPATSITLVLWITTYIILLPVGIPLALHEGLNWNKLRSLRKEPSL